MAGVTLIELIVAMGILTILVSGILPLSYMTYKRSKEIELRQNLRVIRNAIDDYKKMVDDGRIAMELDGTGYPATLEILVEGVDSNDPDPIKYKFLRRIPKDPMTEDGEWGLYGYSKRTLDRNKFDEFKTRFYKLQGWGAAAEDMRRSELEVMSD